VDLHLVYRETRERLLTLAPTLDAAQLATMTLACPAWSVKDIFAHLSGLAGDLAGGVERPGAPEHTTRQVAERTDWPIHEVCDEWTVTGPALERRIEAESPRLRAPVIDVWTHEQDMANALGIVSGPRGAGLFVTLNVLWSMKRKLREAQLPSLRVVTEDIDWVIGDIETTATVTTSSYEMARAVLGRRSLGQIEAYEWDGNPAPYLPLLAWFSPPDSPLVEDSTGD
jgi:uncharacterized protein (TIGR03083 family)